MRGDLVAHDHAGRGAIRELAGIAGADRLAFEHGLDLRQSFGGGIRTRAFVFIQRHLLVADLLRVLVDHRHLGRDRHDLVIEAAALQRGADSALALQAVLVLLVTADLVALGDHFRRLQHRHVHFRLHRHQLVVDGMEFVHVLVLNQADRLDASADRDLDAVEHHRARRDRDRLQAGSALPVDGGAGDGDRQSGADRTFAGDVHHHGALLHGTAHHNVLDFGAPHRFRHDMPRHGRAIGVVECAAIGFADAGTCGGNDYCLGHALNPFLGSRIALRVTC